MKESIAISCLLVFTKLAALQPQSGVCIAANIPLQISKKWQVHSDAGYRTIGSSVYMHQYLYRTGARYFFHHHVSAAAGVAFFSTRTSYSKLKHEFEYEFRLWQWVQVQTLVSSKLTVQNRLRTEQRFFYATNNKQTYFAHRHRVRTGLIWSMNNKWSAELADEYMQQVKNGNAAFHQNRVLFTGSYHLNANTQLQAGHMWLLWSRSSQHMITITFRKNVLINGNKTES
jgi:hypothetical protein